MNRRYSAAAAALLLVAALSACSGRPSRPALESAAQPTVAAGPTAVPPTATPEPPPPGITIEAAGPERPFDRRLLGTNVPAWLGEKLNSPDLRVKTAALGNTVLRLPGGSWSNHYDWLACETGDEALCYWPFAARPSDFINFVRATGHEAMWTVSFNGTAQEAAALVAFFNGAVDDERPIGIDVRGRDWKTVGEWARLRAASGNPEPLPIKLWEVGNEIYGGKEGFGKDCSPWGWEEVWTCDGREYVVGKTDNGIRREGYLEFRAAMRAVDPTIQVGAVGVPQPGEWADWGNEVISAAGDNLDFYVVHYYPYGENPRDYEEILAQPQNTWPKFMGELNKAFQQHAGRQAPVAVTEYNMIAFLDVDQNQLMRRAINALFIADMIGEMAENGVVMANQWNLMNGRGENGADYGMIDNDSGARNPQYYGLMMWTRFGKTLLPVQSSLPADTALSVYAGRDESGAFTLLAINKTAEPITVPVRVEPAPGPLTVTVDELRAAALDTMAVTWNGVAEPAVDLADAPGKQLGTQSGEFEYSFAPYSVTLMRLAPATP